MMNILDCAFFLGNHHNHISVPRSRPGLGTAVDLWQLAFSYSRDEFLSIENIVSRTRDLRAFDPRDKVFGILGLYTREENPHRARLLAPDYSKPIANVFRDLARYSMLIPNTPERLYWLSSVLHSDEEVLQAREFPSWVPRLDLDVTLEVRTNESSKSAESMRELFSTKQLSSSTSGHCYIMGTKPRWRNLIRSSWPRLLIVIHYVLQAD